MMKGKNTFDNYVCDGDTIERHYEGYDFTVRLEFDDTTTPMDYDAEGCCFDTSDPEHGEENREIIEAWKRNEWHYFGLVVSVAYNGVTIDDHVSSVWGYEGNFPKGNNEYLTEEAENLIRESLANVQRTHDEMINKLTGKAA